MGVMADGMKMVVVAVENVLDEVVRDEGYGLAEIGVRAKLRELPKRRLTSIWSISSA